MSTNALQTQQEAIAKARHLPTLRQENPAAFRSEAKQWLRDSSSVLNLWVGSATDNGNVVRTALDAIVADVQSSRFVIENPQNGQYGYQEPQMKIVTADGDPRIVRCPIPKSIAPSDEQIPYLFASVVRNVGRAVDFASDDGCDAKAHFVCEYLRAAGVVDRKIKKIVLFTTSTTGFIPDTPSFSRWHYHVDPLIETESGKQYVISPFFNRDNAISVKEWKQKTVGAKNPDDPDIHVKITPPNQNYDAENRKFVVITQELLENQMQRVAFKNYDIGLNSRFGVGSYLDARAPNPLPMSQMPEAPSPPVVSSEDSCNCIVS